MVDRHAEGRPDLVLTAVALADRAAGVVLGRPELAELLVDTTRLLGLAVLVHERQDRHLDRSDVRGQTEDGALLTADLVLVIGVAEQGEHRATDAGGRL